MSYNQYTTRYKIPEIKHNNTAEARWKQWQQALQLIFWLVSSNLQMVNDKYNSRKSLNIKTTAHYVYTEHIKNVCLYVHNRFFSGFQLYKLATWDQTKNIISWRKTDKMHCKLDIQPQFFMTCAIYASWYGISVVMYKCKLFWLLP